MSAADNALLRDCVVQLLSLVVVPGLRVARSTIPWSSPTGRGFQFQVEIPQDAEVGRDSPIALALVDYLATGNFASLAVVLDEEKDRIDAELNRAVTREDFIVSGFTQYPAGKSNMYDGHDNEAVLGAAGNWYIDLSPSARRGAYLQIDTISDLRAYLHLTRERPT